MIILCTQVVFAAVAGISFIPNSFPTPTLLSSSPHYECSSLKQTAAFTAAYQDPAADVTHSGMPATGAAFTHLFTQSCASRASEIGPVGVQGG